MNHAEVLNRIHKGVDPYKDFPVDQWKGHMLTWGNQHPWFREAIEELKPEVIVEVGTFLGGSAIHMAKICLELGLQTSICCVDTWLGSIDHLTQLHDALHYRHGRPSTYEHFMANVIEQGCQGVIVPVPTDSLNGMRWLKAAEITAPLVYIDGSHEEGDVYRDLMAYYTEILTPGGVLLADDMTGFQSVAADVHKFASALNTSFECREEKARFRKPCPNPTNQA